MLSNHTIVYFDPLSADQPVTASNDTTTADSSTAANSSANTTTSTGTASTATQTTGTGENMMGSIFGLVVPLLLMGVVFYFFLIRPQRKKDKAVKNMLDAVKPGDRICTIGGIYGTIDRLKDDTVTLLVGPEKTKLIVAKWAIRSVENAVVENDAPPEV